MKPVIAILTALVAALWAGEGFGQVDSLWSWTPSINCYFNAIVQTERHGYVLAGDNREGIVLVMIAENGDSLWTRTYSSSIGRGNSPMIAASDGGFVVVGHTFDEFDTYDAFILKTDEHGDSLWSRTYGGEGNQRACSIIQTDDEGFAVIGFTGDFLGDVNDIWLLKTDTDGDSLWGTTFGSHDRERGWSIIQTGDGGFAVGGDTESFGASDWDILLVKLNEEGELIWQHTYGGDDADGMPSLVESEGGGFVLAGTSSSFGAGISDFYLVITDSNGDCLWSHAYGGRSTEECRSIVKTSDRGYALSGSTGSFGHRGSNFWLLRVDERGDSLWSKTFGAADNEYSMSMLQSSNGGFLLTGYKSIGELNPWVVMTTADVIPAMTIQLLEPLNGDTLFDSEAFYSWEAYPDSMFELVLSYSVVLRVGEDSMCTKTDNTEAVIDCYDLVSGRRDWQNVSWGVTAFSENDTIESIRKSVFWVLPEQLVNDIIIVSSDPKMLSAYPNPFNSTLNIRFSGPINREATLRVTDALGREACLPKYIAPNSQRVVWNAEGLPAGKYVIYLEAGGRASSRVVTLLK